MTREQFATLREADYKLRMLERMKERSAMEIFSALSTEIGDDDFYNGVQEIKREAEERLKNLIDLEIEKGTKEFESL